MWGASPTMVAAGSLVALVAGPLQTSAPTTGAAYAAFAAPRIERTFKARPEDSVTTAVSEEASPVIQPAWPEDDIAAQIAEFRTLPAGWDGEHAARPSRRAIEDAMRFIYMAGSLSKGLEPTVHVDGSVILESGDGEDGSLRFRGDGTIICALASMTPQIIKLGGAALPLRSVYLIGTPRGYCGLPGHLCPA
jgi:hypothetical protein